MVLPLSRWRPRHLLLTCTGYWAALALAVLGRPAWTFLQLSQGPKGQLSVAAALGDAGVRLSVVKDGVTAWAGSASPLSIALWIAGPPLLLWVAWMLRRPARSASAEELLAKPEWHTLPATSAGALSGAEGSIGDGFRAKGPAAEPVQPVRKPPG